MRPDLEKILKEPHVILLVVLLVASIGLISFRGIETGLDISGGVRVVMSPNATVTPDELEQARNVLDQRITRVAVKDITTRVVNDVLTGRSYIVVDFAGLTRQEAERYLESEGKFEAKVRNRTVFTRTKRVYTDAQRSGTRQVGPDLFQFHFAVEVTREEAGRFADATGNCSRDPTGQHLVPECNLVLYVDDKQVSDLRIASGLAGKPVTEAVIEGSGATRDGALKEMQFLQAVLSTGALPMKLSIAEVSDVSAKLGGDFRREALLTGALALAMVAAIVFARYRDPALTAAIVTTSSAEIVLILGMASLIRWQIDLAAIAGLIAAVGTGVDSQIIIADTVLSGGSGEGRRVFGWRARISQAFFIIFAAAGTTCSGMLPLTFVGLGSVKGFAITTILGVLIGVLVSRPSFIRILENST